MKCRVVTDYIIVHGGLNMKSYREDVFIAVNKIFQDIADELTNELSLWNPYKVVLCVRNSYEAVLWLGSSQNAEGFLQVFSQSGYDAALASL